MLQVPFIKVESINEEEIAAKLATLEHNKIACVNWAKEYPSSPKVSFKIAHNNENLFLQYFVEENEILAEVQEDNGPVWTDSCLRGTTIKAKRQNFLKC